MPNRIRYTFDELDQFSPGELSKIIIDFLRPAQNNDNISTPPNIEYIQTLLDAGADLFTNPELGYYLFQNICAIEDFNWAKHFINMGLDPNSGINSKGIYRYTILHNITQNSAVDIKMLMLLLNSGANPNILDPFDGDSPLHMAAYFLLEEAMEILIEYGADQDILNFEGLTAWQVLWRREDQVDDPYYN